MLLQSAVSASTELETGAGQQAETVICGGDGSLMCLVFLLHPLLSGGGIYHCTPFWHYSETPFG